MHHCFARTEKLLALELFYYKELVFLLVRYLV